MKLLLVAGLLLRVPVKCAVHIAHVWQGLERLALILQLFSILFYLEATARIQGTTTTRT